MPLRLAIPKFRRSAAAEPDAEGDEVAAIADPIEDEDDDKATMRKRRVARMTTIVFVALAAGQYMQSARNSGVEAVAAGTPMRSPMAMNRGAGIEPGAMLMPASLDMTAGPTTAGPRARAAAMSAAANPGGKGAAAEGLVLISASAEDAIRLPDAPLQAVAPGCEQSLGLTTSPGAMLDLSLTAACHASERVVLRHAGLAVTGKTDAAGGLRAQIPALDAGGTVVVEFADGSEMRAETPVPELDGLRRLGVQWAAGDAFALHGLENGADLLAAGDINLSNPGKMPDGSGKKLKGGWLVALGDASVTAPLLAEIYTYPADPRRKADVAILAEVGPQTCGNEMTGQTLASADGAVSVTDLTLSMPACDGKTGYLVLKNLFPDMKIASSN